MSNTLPATDAAADAEIWAIVAVGAESVNLAAPISLTTHNTDGRRHLVLTVPTAADAAQWARWLYLADSRTQVFEPYVGQSGEQREGFVDYIGDRDGWRWTVRGHGQPPPLITDPVELAAAYGLDWPANACPSCGGKLIKGVCQGAKKCQDPKCTRTCCAPKRQGPVAVQQPGRGAS